MTVLPEGEPLFSDRAFTVTVEDESGGEYLKITDVMTGESIAVEFKEWVMLRIAID